MQEDFVINSLNGLIDSALLEQIKNNIKSTSPDALPQLLGAMFMRIHAESSVKIHVNSREVPLTELVIAILCSECSLPLVEERWSWTHQ